MENFCFNYLTVGDLICVIKVKYVAQNFLLDIIYIGAFPSKGALHTLNQMVNQTVNHLVKCVRVARSPDRRLKLT